MRKNTVFSSSCYKTLTTVETHCVERETNEIDRYLITLPAHVRSHKVHILDLLYYI
jgi:hypothetical protein